MISNKRIKTRNALDRMSEKPELPADAPRVNAYVCNKCLHLIFTVDEALGTTPAFLPCFSDPTVERSSILGMDGEPIMHTTKCDGKMVSTFYTVIPGDYDLETDVLFAWRLPTVKHFRELRRKNLELGDHVAKGGLILAKRNVGDPVVNHGDMIMQPDGTPVSPEYRQLWENAHQTIRDVIASIHREQNRRDGEAKVVRRSRRGKNRSQSKARSRNRR